MMEKKTRKNDLLVRFVSEFKGNERDYKTVCASVKRKLRALLDREGIIAIVSARVKDPDRLLRKLKDRDKKRHYSDAEHIFQDIHDLVGARIALYFPSDAEKLLTLLEKDFELQEPPKLFPEKVDLPLEEEIDDDGTIRKVQKFTASKRKIYPGYAPRRFDGYCAVHYRVKMKYPPALNVPNPTIEIQVASVLMHAWSEVEHDLAYKNMMGQVSMEEYEALDEINGLVIAGEVALNRLDRLSQERLRKDGVLDTVYVLAAYLSDWLESRKKDWIKAQLDADGTLTEASLLDKAAKERLFELGNVKSLFDRYTGGGKKNRDTRRKVRSDLKDLDYEPAEPLAEQLLALHEMPEITKPPAPKKKAEPVFEVSDPGLLGAYLVDWINLQRSLRNALRAHGFQGSGDGDVYRFVVENFELSEQLRKSYQALHLERNKIIHGNFSPAATYLKKQREGIAAFLELMEAERG